MGDQRILNPDIRVGTAFDRMVGRNADLMVMLMTTFRYSRWARGEVGGCRCCLDAGCAGVRVFWCFWGGERGEGSRLLGGGSREA